MNRELEDCDSDSGLDCFIGSIAREVYASSDSLLSGRQTELDNEDLCPLYNSMLQISERYHTPKLVGRGGMKEVYRVYDEKTARHVALAKPLRGHGKDRFDAFLREAHLTARLEHPGIIEVYDMGVDKQQRPFFIMEFKRGRSLRDLIHEIRADRTGRQYSLRRRLEIFTRICEAIAYAHSRRVLHLDIKPSNIQIGEFGEVQVCDWGLGVVMPDEDSSHSSSALLDPDLYGPLFLNTKGTPVYMAPEQSDQLQPKRPQMDIYALGCVLYELMTGQKYLSDRPRKKVAAGVAAIVAKACATDPEDRYQSVNELNNDVARFVSHQSPSAEKLSLLREANLFWKRHREACLVVLGASVLLAGFLAYFVLQLRGKEQKAVFARNRAETAKQEAVELMGKYRNKVVESERLVHDLRVSNTRIETFRIQDHKLFTGDGSQENVRRAIGLYSKLIDEKTARDSKVWSILFWWNLVAQDFKAAQELTKKGTSIKPQDGRIAKRFAPLLNEKGFLETDDFIDFLRSFRNQKFLCSRALVYDKSNQRPLDERVRIVRSWLDSQNGGTGEVDLEYDQDSRRLRLLGPVGKIAESVRLSRSYYVDLNYLQTLDPLILDIRGTKIKSLNQLKGINPIEVDIRNTPISKLAPLSKFRSLQRIVVGEGQFSPSQLNAVAPWIKVIVHQPELTASEPPL